MSHSIARGAASSSLGTWGAAGFLLASSAACTFPAPSYAADNWNTADKKMHLAGSTMLGAVASSLTQSNGWAYGGCLAVGAGKELVSWAANSANRPSAKDMAANAMGCGIGLGVGRFSVSRNPGGAQVTYSWEY